MTLKPLIRVTVAVALALGSAHAADDPVVKVDNGLGELPPYNQWERHPDLARFVQRDRIDGEKLDSGLGELPPYREWKNHPELARLVVKEKRDSVAWRAGE